MPYCSNKKELTRLLELKINLITSAEIEEDFSLRIENSENWDDSLTALSYFFSQFLEAYNSEEGLDLINIFFELPNKMWFNIQDFDDPFVSYLSRYIKKESLSLEDNLIYIQDAFDSFRYE